MLRYSNLNIKIIFKYKMKIKLYYNNINNAELNLNQKK